MRATVVLPEPDSPTSPSVSPASMRERNVFDHGVLFRAQPGAPRIAL